MKIVNRDLTVEKDGVPGYLRTRIAKNRARAY